MGREFQKTFVRAVLGRQRSGYLQKDRSGCKRSGHLKKTDRGITRSRVLLSTSESSENWCEAGCWEAHTGDANAVEDACPVGACPLRVASVLGKMGKSVSQDNSGKLALAVVQGEAMSP